MLIKKLKIQTYKKGKFVLYILISVICAESIKNLKSLINVPLEPFVVSLILSLNQPCVICTQIDVKCMIGNLSKLCHNTHLHFKDLE